MVSSISVLISGAVVVTTNVLALYSTEVDRIEVVSMSIGTGFMSAAVGCGGGGTVTIGVIVVVVDGNTIS